MAKKKRYSQRPPAKRNLGNRPAPTSSTPNPPLSVQPKVTVDTELSSGQLTGSRKAPDFSQEYHYVVSDLKRVAILAAALILLLIVLSFVL